MIAVVLAALVFLAGCASQPATNTYTPQPTAQPAATASAAGPVTASLPYGVTLTLPAGWTRADVMTSDNRDYGRRAIRIATFSTPETVPGDAKSVNTLSVDLDENPGADFEAYFNEATLATEQYYKTQLDSHSIVKSSTLTVSGYKSYQLDFQTGDVKGYSIFTKTDRGMYVFSFLGENTPVAVRSLQGDTAGIVKSIAIAV
jgi:hypothetical protein